MAAVSSHFDLGDALAALQDSSAVSPSDDGDYACAQFQPSGSATPARLAFPSAIGTPPAKPSPVQSTDEYDQEQISTFFAMKSAHLDSPIFPTSARRMEYARQTPQLHVDPKQPSNSHASSAIPDDIVPELLKEISFHPLLGLQPLHEIDLHWRAARVPLPYAIRVQFQANAMVRPKYAYFSNQLTTNSDMFVLVVTENVHVLQPPSNILFDDDFDENRTGTFHSQVVTSDAHHENAPDSADKDLDPSDNEYDDILLTFWAAPGMELRRGSATLMLTIVDTDDVQHTAHIRLFAKGTKPVLAVEAPASPADSSRKHTDVVFLGGHNFAEQTITIWNETENGAPVLVAICLQDSSNGAFHIGGGDGDSEQQSIVTTIQSGSYFSVVANFELPSSHASSEPPSCYYGHAFVRLAYFLPHDPNLDDQLQNFYDHVVYFKAPREGVANLPSSRTSCGIRSVDQRSLYSLSDPCSEPVVHSSGLHNSDNATSAIQHPERRSSVEDAPCDDAADENPLRDDLAAGEEEDICQELSNLEMDRPWEQPFHVTEAPTYTGFTPSLRHDNASPKQARLPSERAWDTGQSIDMALSPGACLADAAGVQEPGISGTEHDLDAEAARHSEDMDTRNALAPYVREEMPKKGPNSIPKLRMPRSVRKRGMRIDGSSSQTALPLMNACKEPLEVRVALGNRRESDLITVSSNLLVIEPNSRGDVVVSRNTTAGGEQVVRVVCSFVNCTSVSTVYEVPLRVDASKRRIMPPSGIVLDRPTLSFYNLAEGDRTCQLRILNAFPNSVDFKATIRKVEYFASKCDPPDAAGKGEDCANSGVDAKEPFSVLPRERIRMEENSILALDVRFNFSESRRAGHYTAVLDLCFNDQHDEVPIFGYCGKSDIRLKQDGDGLLHLRNTGRRCGFVLYQKGRRFEHDTALSSTGRVLAPGEHVQMQVSQEAEGVIFIGDEIVRSRLRQAVQLGLVEGKGTDGYQQFIIDFEGQDKAVTEEHLTWNVCPHSMHYAGRQFDIAVRVLKVDKDSGNWIVAKDASEMDGGWDARMADNGFVQIENYDVCNGLHFEAHGAEPKWGTLPALGDATLASYSERVQVTAKGRTIVLTAS